jgi:outer membrane receptor protein involved in Fe transport
MSPLLRPLSNLISTAALVAITSIASAASAPPSPNGASTGVVTGTVVDPLANRPVEYATVTIKNKAADRVVTAGVTDAKGGFDLENIPVGDYRLFYSYVGTAGSEAIPFTIDAGHRKVDLGRLSLDGETAVKLEKVEVSARKEAFYNSIDRKVYNVGKDIRSAGGSASDLLQNVPSVQVSVDGNVSLRGNDSVLILVNGKPSTLMSAANRADVLAQMPADAIERIEVITNPSAKYKPDGTAGIINLVEKRKHEAGYSGVLRASVGNAQRSNFGFSANYNPGKYNVFTTASARQDDRPRFSQDVRRHLDAATNTFITTEQSSVEHMRPLSRLAQVGGDYNIDAENKVGATASYNYRTFFRTGSVSNLSRAADGTVSSDYDRQRTDPEWQKTMEFATTFQHSFAEEGHELSMELKHDRHWEQEDNHYANVYRTPVTPTSQDYTLIKPTETATELTADYARPLPNDAKLEAGYAGEANKNDMDFRGGFFDPIARTWNMDTTRTNRFIYRDAIHAFYATYGRPIGQFGFLAGVRLEQTSVDTNQVTTRLTDKNDYFRFYPSLHLSYNLTETSQLQLNYSHRVRRPESDDLNPFPEYQDPYNLRAGNPKLRPEETHSIETGYQYRKDDTTYLAALYFRDTYHAFTTVTRYIDSVTLLTTHENLASNRSGGLELAATTTLGSHVSLNFSSNAFYSEIDASNLGYRGSRSAIAWDAKLNLDWHLTKTDLIQINTNYSAKRLTAQGYRLPTHVGNLGWRHDFKGKNTAFVLTISDVLNSLKERTVIDTPVLHDDSTRRRSSRIIYAGFIYNFGKPAKKKDDLQFDNAL